MSARVKVLVFGLKSWCQGSAFGLSLCLSVCRSVFLGFLNGWTEGSSSFRAPPPGEECVVGHALACIEIG